MSFWSKIRKKRDNRSELSSDLKINSNEEVEENEEVPHVKGKALGYRSWNIVDNPLQHSALATSSSALNSNSKKLLKPLSMSIKYSWLPGENQAVCGYCQDLPERYCRCGFYSFNNLKNALIYIRPFKFLLLTGKRRKMIVGSVAGYGKVQIHQTGWRAAKAEIIAFLYVGGRNKQSLTEAKEIAREFQVPIFFNKKQFKKYSEGKAVKIPDGWLNNLPILDKILNWIESKAMLWAILIIVFLFFNYLFDYFNLIQLSEGAHVVWLLAIGLSMLSSMTSLLRR